MHSVEPAAAAAQRRVGANRRFPWARLRAVGEILLLALPGLGVLHYVCGLYVEMPVFDQLFMVPFFEKVHEGSATLEDYVARWGAGGIHHIIFPRLIFAALSLASNWTLKYEVLTNFGLAAITFLALWRLAVLTSEGGSWRLRLTANLLTSLLLFSPVQHWNWRYGFSLAIFLTNASVVGAVLMLAGTRRGFPMIRIILAAGFCVVATFSMAQGTASWVALAPLVALVAHSSRRPGAITGSWLALAIASCVLFFLGYSPTEDSNFARVARTLLNAPLPALSHWLALLGSPLAYFSAFTAIPQNHTALAFVPIGGAVVAAFLSLSLLLVLRAGHEVLWRAAPWMALGLFSLLYAAMNTMGRSFDVGLFDKTQYVSMYSTPSIFTTIAVVQLGAIAWVQQLQVKARTGGRRIAARVLVVGALALAMLELANLWTLLPHLYAQRRRAVGHERCFELRDYLSAAECAWAGSQKIPFVASRRPGPRQLEFLAEERETYGEIYDARLGSFSKFSVGTLNLRKKRLAETVAVIRGRADPPRDFDAAPIVLLELGGSQSFFDFAVLERDGSWSEAIGPWDLPGGRSRLRAWIYDPDRSAVAPLRGNAWIEKQGGRLTGAWVGHEPITWRDRSPRKKRPRMVTARAPSRPASALSAVVATTVRPSAGATASWKK